MAATDDARARQRLINKIQPDETTGCWLWTAYIDDDGYGQVGWQGRVWRAHRLVYELVKGPIPDGLTLDHLADICPNRHCVNPDHTEPVTRGENAALGIAYRRDDYGDCCVHGHRWDEDDNLYVSPKGTWICRTCRREQQAAGAERNADRDPATIPRLRTHCPRCHDYEETGYIQPSGSRRCSVCETARSSRRAAKQKAERALSRASQARSKRGGDLEPEWAR